MKVKEFKELLKPYLEECYTMNISAFITKGWYYSISIAVTDVIVEDEQKSVYISNSFNSCNDELCLEDIYDIIGDNDDYEVYFEIYSLNKFGMNNQIIVENPSVKDVNIYIDSSEIDENLIISFYYDFIVKDLGIDYDKGMIICGFAGIGKSFLAKKYERVVDLESTPFQKDWETYIRVANHMRNNGYIVLMSCHDELREELHKQDIPYFVALPTVYEKDIYIERYRDRGNNEEFIKLMDSNFEKFCEAKEWEYPNNCIRIYNGEYLSNTLYNLLERNKRGK